VTLGTLRTYAAARTLFAPTTLSRAIRRLGFVQADPICAPAAAQDLILRHRVAGYRNGDLERRYARLSADEGFFINYGFLPREHYLLMHPRARTGYPGHGARATRRMQVVLAFIQERGSVHPRDVDAHFDHGTVVNPHLSDDIRPALGRAKQRLASATIDGGEWYWPRNENPATVSADDTVRLLTPFDPIVWDRRRFELLWGWAYRFEAYTPKARRQRGYYALPILWRDCVIGWANVSVKDGGIACELGFAGSRPRERAFDRELDAEIERMRTFLDPNAHSRLKGTDAILADEVRARGIHD
jgi:uncharacterized protein YcaQ